MQWLKDINVLIFDMDGTLYQDYTFMGRYIHKMMAGNFPESEIEETVALAYDILEGRRHVKLGFMYDPASLVFYRQQDLHPVTSYDWDGLELEITESEENALAYIGDPWGIAQLMAYWKNVLADEVKRAFDDVRKEMLTEAYCIIKRTDLFEEIRNLEDKRLILMTNSPLPTGQEFVDFLEINEVFDEFYFDGQKPYGIEELFGKLLVEGYEPHEILSIGDHPWNDLYPVHKAGGHTCLISEYKHDDATGWSASVESIDELAGLIRRLNEETTAAKRKEETYG
jgi:FMN phosphatase YigB (HAD superfamily)